MPRFQFRLKTLLSLREATRDERQSHLAASLADERALTDRRATLEAELAELHDRNRSATAPGPLDLDRLQSGNRYELVLRSEIADLSTRELALADEIESRRQSLAEADREVRVLEKLRARQLDQFRQQQSMRETKQLDEAGRAIQDESR